MLMELQAAAIAFMQYSAELAASPPRAELLTSARSNHIRQNIPRRGCFAGY